MKLTKREAIITLLFGMAGAIMGQNEKFKLAPPFKFEPMWLEVSSEQCKGVRLTRNGKNIDITMDEIWEALNGKK